MAFNKKERGGNMETLSVEASTGVKTEDELRGLSLQELMEYRGEFEEKLAYMRKNNPAENEMLKDNEEYNRLIEKIYNEKMEEGR